jgi:nucleoid DNA-binding protein
LAQKNSEEKSPGFNAVKMVFDAGKIGDGRIKDITKEIEGRPVLSLGDVQSVLSNLVAVLPIFLKLGQSVNLEGFGTFRLQFHADKLSYMVSFFINISNYKINITKVFHFNFMDNNWILRTITWSANIYNFLFKVSLKKFFWTYTH